MVGKGRCDKRCWYAKSSPLKCRCSCGGMNHGHGMFGAEMAKIQMKYPPCTPVRIKKNGKPHFTGISTSETFVFAGEIFLGVQSGDLTHYVLPETIEKIYGPEKDTGAV